ncbi:Hypothetical predicted protein [Octopus vulgaris]|uniref:Uncharacterized protein n=1 Tax=Octopus vulgaris TaxID=6645 RepID=A0AA36BBQ9_OCTVU|nr:Hypothetical predicted protein [Octopus vulgaris]
MAPAMEAVTQRASANTKNLTPAPTTKEAITQKASVNNKETKTTVRRKEKRNIIIRLHNKNGGNAVFYLQYPL